MVTMAYGHDDDSENPAAEQQIALSGYKGNRATDNIFALETYVDTLAFDLKVDEMREGGIAFKVGCGSGGYPNAADSTGCSSSAR